MEIYPSMVTAHILKFLNIKSEIGSMILAAGDLGILIDFDNDEPGSILQLRESPFSDVWRDYLVEDKSVTAPVDIETLSPGEYRFSLSRN